MSKDFNVYKWRRDHLFESPEENKEIKEKLDTFYKELLSINKDK